MGDHLKWEKSREQRCLELMEDVGVIKISPPSPGLLIMYVMYAFCVIPDNCSVDMYGKIIVAFMHNKYGCNENAKKGKRYKFHLWVIISSMSKNNKSE